jgi:hypothetical protein
VLTAGERSKKPAGWSEKLAYSIGMTGQSSVRGMCVTPKMYLYTNPRTRLSFHFISFHFISFGHQPTQTMQRCLTAQAMASFKETLFHIC